jgi:predicted nucleotidyltransferase component of viral defense system
MSNVEEYNINAWVEGAPTETNKEFREATHTILSAIAADENLKASMVLKGGILLAIRYKSHRYTTDIDFSTEKKLGGDITEEGVRKSLDKSLSQMVETLNYDLDCRVQSSKLQPKNRDSSFPSIKMTIGYAYKGTAAHKRLMSLQSPKTISIDYSLNESIPNCETLKLDIEDGVLAYSLTDLIAEKYRSLLQQVSRNRSRRQDVYDLHILIKTLDDDIDGSEKSKILDCLIKKSRARNIDPRIESIDDPELKCRAKKDYPTLADEIEGDLPDFEEIFEVVSNFYKSLPWK